MVWYKAKIRTVAQPVVATFLLQEAKFDPKPAD